jgi:hypothetical protein
MHVLDAVWVNEKGLLPRENVTTVQHLSALRCTREIFMLGPYAVHRINGRASSVQAYQSPLRADRIALIVKDWIVHEILLRELDENDATVREIDPLAETQALLRDGATAQSRPLVPFDPGRVPETFRGKPPEGRADRNPRAE